MKGPEKESGKGGHHGIFLIGSNNSASTRGLGKDPFIVDELVLDVNTACSLLQPLINEAQLICPV